MNRNYNKQFKTEMELVKSSSTKPKLLLHSCCAPCSSEVLRRIHDFFDITIYYFNPNIDEEAEYLKRAGELIRLVNEMLPGDNIKIVVPEFDTMPFDKIATGLENEPEKGKRCYKCYRMRLEQSAKFAGENGYDYFTTTLSISRYKNAVWINEIGQEMAEKYSVKFLTSDFKKENGYENSILLSEKYNLYRQDFCGCRYSKKNK